MLTNFSNRDARFAKIYHWIGIAFVCIVSVPLHFLYEWSGELPAAGLFAPINESIWEHLKLVFWPLLLWWGIGYVLFKNSKNLSRYKWFTAAAVSAFLSMAVIVAWYYTWTGGFHIESPVIDIGSLFIAVPIGQLVAIHVYRVVEPRMIYLILAGAFFVVFSGMFFLFTFFAPDFPIFIPPT